MSFILEEMSAERNVEKLVPVFVQGSWRSSTEPPKTKERNPSTVPALT